MRLIDRPKTFIKLTIIVAFSVLAVAVFLSNGRQKAAASASGPSPSYTEAPGENNCTACHTDFQVNSGTGSVQISGVPQNYVPGQQISVTVTTSQIGAVNYGFQLTAIDQTGKTVGTFTVPPHSPALIQIKTNIVGGQTRKYVEHTVDGINPTMFDTLSWTFNWAAPNPAVGQINFYAAGNAANGDRATSGDYIYTTFRSTSQASTGLVTVGGRIYMSDGVRGLRNTTVALTDQNNTVRTATTSSFGFYAFANVQASATYTITVKSRLYRFAPQTIFVGGDLSNVDFIGLE